MVNTLWRCRRGTKELDLLLEHYFKTNGGKFTAEQLAHFHALLDLSDDVLIAWFLEEQIIDPKFHSLVNDIKSCYNLK